MKIIISISLILVFTFASGCTQTPTDMSLKRIDTKDNDPGNYPIERSEQEWKNQLQPLQYQVLRESGTERPFTGEFYKTDQAGIYFSAGSGQPLFLSDSKFDSGCGWPSFFEPITKNSILYRSDRTHGMVRTEIIDSGSGSHLGHVFNDGPAPTGLRYCLNSAAMLFVSAGEPFPAIVEKYMDEHASEEEIKAVNDFLQNTSP